MGIRVCEKLLPKGSYKGQKKDGFPMNAVLKANLDALIKNVTKDWDFVLIISGGGMVRVGKSVLGLQIAAYWVDQLKKVHGVDVPFTAKENLVFHGNDLIKKGNALGKKYPNSVLIFDEAGADLEGIKVMRRTTQAVKDYLRECGQYNMLTILVLPEFFDLPKGIALSRADFLLDVYRCSDSTGLFRRGYFKFYSRPNKKQLYLRGKKELNYKAWKYDFRGEFSDAYPIDEEDYRTLKRIALKSRAKLTSRELRLKEYLRGLVTYLANQGNSYRSIARIIKDTTGFNANYMYLSGIVGKPENEEELPAVDEEIEGKEQLKLGVLPPIG